MPVAKKATPYHFSEQAGKNGGFATAKKPGQISRTQRLHSPIASSSRVKLDRADGTSRRQRKPTPSTPPAQSLDSNVIPKVSRVNLSDLECVRMLGDGGWAEVYLAQVKSRTTPESGAVFAMKTISKRIFRDTERNDDCWDRDIAAAKKHAERRILSKLPWNPFIIGLLDAYVDVRNTYLMLEYAPCGTLLDHVQRTGGLHLHDALFYYSNIILGIEFLHSQGIIHRDIKTDNVLIGADGYAMITDFGLSRYIDERTEWTDHIGTISFMSPEALAKNMGSRESRYAVDWWAAAVTFFDMLMNALPFNGVGVTKIQESVTAQKIHYNRPVPSAIAKFFQNAFMYDLDKRFGALSTPRPNGSMINAELRSHPLFKDIRWNRIALRVDPAPFVPDPIPDPREEVHSRPLPEQRKLPELKLKRPPPLLEFNEIRADAERARKRQRVEKEASETIHRAPSTTQAEAGSAA
ncbi:kinase-like protein [Dichomitus squalens LYAD-421 SS1]|uniref:kinase-like protein n=1 Tax=Dichomitus squalens (strain LYAD-421) TaxID=732165 RepID=UPI0004415A36|nr:kinase-like protein [Dichomitus squalens LYAD-421 SS1]EJF66154.1 kinase-like protein [Dichomitus squalens LYAD-421 SS1]